VPLTEVVIVVLRLFFPAVGTGLVSAMSLYALLAEELPTCLVLLWTPGQVHTDHTLQVIRFSLDEGISKPTNAVGSHFERSLFLPYMEGS